MKLLKDALAAYVRRFHRGVNEEAIGRYAATLPDEVQDSGFYDEALAELVERDGLLTWRLPARMGDGHPDALSTPLIYQAVP